jgi:molecular chaperone DnaK (HSP70)
VGFTETERLIGDAAKNQVARNPEHTIFDAKRLIGRKYNDEFVKKCYELLSYDIVMNERECISFKTHNNKLITPEEISAEILIKIKQNACNYLKRPVKDVVITVPAHFNDSQRQSTQDACKIAGLNCVRMLNEPTAGAIAFGMIEKSLETQKMILVYDFGGGTLDCSILSIDSGVFQVKSTSGDTHLGGEDFDNKLRDYCFMKFCDKYILQTKYISKQ